MERFVFFFAIMEFGLLLGSAQSQEWKPLFNGKDLSGWEHVGPGKFVLESGWLKSEGGMGLLWYKREKIGNATLRVVYKTASRDTNSGVYIRIPDKPTEPWMPVNKGNEVQIFDPGNDYHCTGVIYSFSKAMARPYKPVGEWNTMDITLDGPRTVVLLNGVKVTDYSQNDPEPPKADEGEPDRGRRPDSGYIGLQNHDEKSVIYFREVSLTPLL